MVSINTNIAALTAQRNLEINSARANSSIAKLSSGSRVPTAKDDAAALAIGSRLNSEVVSLKQASLNAGQANSLLQIADGAQSQIGDILARMQSLAVQSNSGQLSSTERTILNSEFVSLRSEIDRISNDTKFNGVSLLAGGDTTQVINQAVDGVLEENGLSVEFTGAGTATTLDTFRITYVAATNVLTATNTNTGEKVSKDITSDLQTATGSTADPVVTDLSAGETLTIEFGDLGLNVTLDDQFDTNVDKALATNEGTISNGTNVTLVDGDLTNFVFNETGLTDSFVTNLRAAGAFDSETGELTLDVQGTGANTLELSAVGIEISVDGGTSFTASGGTVDIDGSAAGAQTIILREASTDIEFLTFDIGTGGDASNAGTAGTVLIDMEEALFGVTLATSTATTTFDFQVGTGTTTSQDQISISLTASTAAQLGINASTITDMTTAAASITALETAVTTLNTARAAVGAGQSRLGFAAANLATSIENNTAARSALLDADVASEITDFTSQQVLIQAGVSILAQANQQPSILVQLLQ